MVPKRASEGKWIFQVESEKKLPPTSNWAAAWKAASPTWNRRGRVQEECLRKKRVGESYRRFAVLKGIKGDFGAQLESLGMSQP